MAEKTWEVKKRLLSTGQKAFELVKKVPVGATLGRPWILPKQNPSPQGENTVIFLREIRKTTFFGGRARLAPTILSGKQVL
ncbi:MAG: hypothetical protein IKU32_08735 [Clostridia bacterium]|nr:hypothetical protein [Clostridia bacterium]